jgi:hypothetical protein
MISLAIKFRSKEEMEKWVKDRQSYRAIPDSATVRLEDALDTFAERYVLTDRLDSAGRPERKRSKGKEEA